MKQEIIDFRKEIAVLEAVQKNTKEQRKTVYCKVERTMNPYHACCMATTNKDNLRAMYAAYGLMRGKKFSQIENKWDNALPHHPLLEYANSINGMLNKYGYTMEYEEKKNYWGNKIKVFKDGCDEKIIRLGE